MTQYTFLDFSADFGHVLAGYDHINVLPQIYDFNRCQSLQIDIDPLSGFANGLSNLSYGLVFALFQDIQKLVGICYTESPALVVLIANPGLVAIGSDIDWRTIIYLFYRLASGERNSDLGDSLYRVIAKSSINPHRKLQIVLTWTTDDITLQESKI